MALEIILTDVAEEAFEAIRVDDRRRIAAAIDRQLLHEPTKEARNRKRLLNVSPDFDFDPPLWELRVSKFRVFYDVDEDASVVYVRAIRRKPRGKTTRDVVHEDDDR